MKYRILAALAILVVVGYIISRTVSLKQVGELLSSFPKNQLFIIFLIASFILFLKAWRFIFLIRESKINISLWEALKISLAGGATSPFPGGEAMRGFLLRFETDVKPHSATSAIISQAFLEVFVAAVISFFGSFVIPQLLLPSFLVLSLLTFIGLVFIYPPFLGMVLKLVHKVTFLNKIAKNLEKTQSQIRKNNLYKVYYPDKAVIQTIAIIFVSNIIGGILIYIIAKSFGIELDLIRTTIIYSSSIVIQTVTGIVPGGLGFTEGGMTGIFLLTGVSVSQSIAIILLFRIATLLYGVLVGFIFLGIFYSKPLLKKGFA